MKQVVGWLLILVGMPLTFAFAMLTLYYLGRGPYGIIIAIYFTGPLFLVGLGSSVLGSYLRKSFMQDAAHRPRVKSGVRS
jgi:hypothetical protein